MNDNEMNHAVGRIEGKLDQVISTLTDHGERLGAVEKQFSWASGLVRATVAMLTAAAVVVGWWIAL